MKRNKKISISQYENYTIAELISLLKQNKIQKNDKFSFELDYGDCYYEGDSPSISIDIKPRKNISKK